MAEKQKLGLLGGNAQEIKDNLETLAAPIKYKLEIDLSWAIK